MTDMPAFRPGALTYEFDSRGLTDADVAQLTGLSRATVAAARQGRKVSQRTVVLVLEALRRRPRLVGAELIAPRDPNSDPTSAAVAPGVPAMAATSPHPNGGAP